ncbi:DUF350 domain-containing protein [Alkanindiges illinoisensis]|uniref:DUF350 domain-containing protein n=1 Tax=Alkanindiges illinoisensis TaxID=197183 RepID=UPI00047884C9|nr:DUF350 domain-containing protein [Alkanindiges illinoisensis]
MTIILTQYLLYLKYMGLSLFVLMIFAVVYVKVTPVKEITLIREGNIACALSFGGAQIGFSITLASSIMHTMNIPSFLVWSFAAALVQILIFFAGSRLIRDASMHLQNNNIAVGALFGSLSLSVGLINAACLS